MKPCTTLRCGRASVPSGSPHRTPLTPLFTKYQSVPRLMHARELVELAAIVSAHGPVLVRGRGRFQPRHPAVLDGIEMPPGPLGPEPRNFTADGHTTSRPRRSSGPRSAASGRDSHQRNAHPRVDGRALRLRPPARHAGSRTDRPKRVDRPPRSAASRADAAGPRTGHRCRVGHATEPPTPADGTLDRPIDRILPCWRVTSSPSSPSGPATSPSDFRLQSPCRAAATPGRWCSLRCGRPSARACADQSQRRSERPHRHRHSLRFPPTVRFHRPVPLALAVAAFQRGQRTGQVIDDLLALEIAAR